MPIELLHWSTKRVGKKFNQNIAKMHCAQDYDFGARMH